jgi:hypothetical protein
VIFIFSRAASGPVNALKNERPMRAKKERNNFHAHYSQFIYLSARIYFPSSSLNHALGFYLNAAAAAAAIYKI